MPVGSDSRPSPHPESPKWVWGLRRGPWRAPTRGPWPRARGCRRVEARRPARNAPRNREGGLGEEGVGLGAARGGPTPRARCPAGAGDSPGSPERPGGGFWVLGAPQAVRGQQGGRRGRVPSAPRQRGCPLKVSPSGKLRQGRAVSQQRDPVGFGSPASPPPVLSPSPFPSRLSGEFMAALAGAGGLFLDAIKSCRCCWCRAPRVARREYSRWVPRHLPPGGCSPTGGGSGCRGCSPRGPGWGCSSCVRPGPRFC